MSEVLNHQGFLAVKKSSNRITPVLRRLVTVDEPMMEQNSALLSCLCGWDAPLNGLEISITQLFGGGNTGANVARSSGGSN